MALFLAHTHFYMCKFFIEELDTSYLWVVFQNMLLNFIHKTAFGYYSMKNGYVYSVERKALDGMLAWCSTIYPNDSHDYILRKINQYKVDKFELQLNKISNKLFYLLSSNKREQYYFFKLSNYTTLR